MYLDKKNNRCRNSSLSTKQKVVGQEEYIVEDKKRTIGSLFKKGLMILGLSFILWNVLKESPEYTPQISINKEYDEDSYFATYSEGKVYICKQNDLAKICSIVGPKDIIVIDKKNSDNPDMCIFNSYRIENPEVINEVLIILEEYERMYPTQWDRSIDSMHNEWVVHNLLYGLKIKVDSTTHVDLDNEDENLFDSPILSKILNN